MARNRNRHKSPAPGERTMARYNRAAQRTDELIEEASEFQPEQPASKEKALTNEVAAVSAAVRDLGELPPGMQYGDPVYANSKGIDMQIGVVASDADVRELDNEHRVVVVRMLSQQVGDQAQPLESPYRIAVKVSRENATRLLQLVKEQGSNELDLRVSGSKQTATWTTTAAAPEHIALARDVYARMQKVGLDLLPPTMRPGDGVYAGEVASESVLVGRIADLEEIESPPPDTRVQYLQMEREGEEGPYQVPVLFQGPAARAVTRMALREGRESIRLAIVAASGEQYELPVTESSLLGSGDSADTLIASYMGQQSEVELPPEAREVIDRRVTAGATPEQAIRGLLKEGALRTTPAQLAQAARVRERRAANRGKLIRIARELLPGLNATSAASMRKLIEEAEGHPERDLDKATLRELFTNLSSEEDTPPSLREAFADFIRKLQQAEQEDESVEASGLDDELSSARCDFCRRQAKPAWVYPARDFAMPVPGKDEDWHSEGGWAACEECAPLIERKDWARLVRRNMKSHPVAAEEREAHSFWQQQRFQEFERNRAGPRERMRSSVSGSMPSERELSRAFSRAFKQSAAKPPPNSAEAVCDFDSARPVVWRYAAMSFDFWPEGVSQREKPWHSEADWAACASCSRLVEKRDWDALVKRHMRAELAEITSEMQPDTLGPQTRAALERWLTRQALEIFQLFSKHRTGERVPVFPDADVRLPTSSPLAQIAFGEQLKLLRWVQTTEGKTYIENWIENPDHHPHLKVGWQPSEATRQGSQNVALVPLRYGETYYWTGEICRMIAAAAEVLGSDTPWTLLREAVPSTSGFFYCERPVGKSADAPLRAISWTLCFGEADYAWNAGIRINPQGRGNPELANGIVLTFYSETPQRALRLSGFQFWRFGDTHMTAASYPMQAAPELTIEDFDHQRLAVFATMLAFVQQKIIVPSRPFTPDRQTRKQAERERPEREPILRIIELRRRERVGYTPPTDHKVIDWQWQWRVRPFWRSQFYPSLGIHQPKYIEGFWKGPIGAPIKPPTRIFVVDQ